MDARTTSQLAPITNTRKAERISKLRLFCSYPRAAANVGRHIQFGKENKYGPHSLTQPHLDQLTELAKTVLERHSPVSVCQRIQLMDTARKKDNTVKLQRKEARGLRHGTEKSNRMDKKRNKVSGNKELGFLSTGNNTLSTDYCTHFVSEQ